MIIFELGCKQGHRFEGWFASAEDFARQSEGEMVRCPTCDDGRVAIVPSARVRVSKSANLDRSEQSGRGRVATCSDTARAEESQVRTVKSDDSAPLAPIGQRDSSTRSQELTLPPEFMQQLREVIRNTENVGRRFPEEARKIHYDEVPPRPIRGQASREEAEALREEGIEFASLPEFLASDQH